MKCDVNLNNSLIFGVSIAICAVSFYYDDRVNLSEQILIIDSLQKGYD